MGMAAILIYGPWPFEQILNPPLTEGSTWNFKKIGPGVSEEKSFKGVDWQTDGRWQVITIAHPQPLAQGSYKFSVCVLDLEVMKRGVIILHKILDQYLSL